MFVFSEKQRDRLNSWVLLAEYTVMNRNYPSGKPELLREMWTNALIPLNMPLIDRSCNIFFS